MSYVSTIRIRFKSEAASAVERHFNEQFVPLRRKLQEQGDLESMLLVRSEREAGTYELVSRWASKEAHDRNEDSPAEQQLAQSLGSYVMAPPDEFDGTIVAEVR